MVVGIVSNPDLGPGSGRWVVLSAGPGSIGAGQHLCPHHDRRSVAEAEIEIETASEMNETTTDHVGLDTVTEGGSAPDYDRGSRAGRNEFGIVTGIEVVMCYTSGDGGPISISTETMRSRKGGPAGACLDHGSSNGSADFGCSLGFCRLTPEYRSVCRFGIGLGSRIAIVIGSEILIVTSIGAETARVGEMVILFVI